MMSFARNDRALLFTLLLAGCGSTGYAPPPPATAATAVTAHVDSTGTSGASTATAGAPGPSPSDKTGDEKEADKSAGKTGATPPSTSLDVSAAGMSAIAPASASGAAAATAPVRPTRIGARHVLIQYMGAKSAPSSIVRTREQAYAVAREVWKRAKGGEDFARLAVEYSDEPNAGSRGGSLGVFGHGQMVQQFEDAAFALKVGEISPIVETPFGYHIILRTE
jgi:peptidyl-prolyl cis-trans isomerase NIMA-interacting 1